MGGGFIVAVGILLMAFCFSSGYGALGVVIGVLSIPAAIAFESMQA